MIKNNSVVKFYHHFVGRHHVNLGTLSAFSQKLAITMSEIAFSVGIIPTAQSIYLVKYLSACVIAFGVMMVIAATNPQKYRKFIDVGISLIVIRIFQRIVFFSQLNDAFGINITKKPKLA
jgi:hypothetical protein